MYIIGIIVFFLGFYVFSATALNGNMFFYYFDTATIFLHILSIASVIIATNNFKTFIKAVNALFSKKYNITAADKEKAVRLFKLLRHTTICSSVVFTITDCIVILGSLSDITAIGPNVALALFSIFLGAFIILIFINPAIHILETRYNIEEKTVISERQVIDKLLELCYKQGISPEDILNADEIDFKKHQ